MLNLLGRHQYNQYTATDQTQGRGDSGQLLQGWGQRHQGRRVHPGKRTVKMREVRKNGRELRTDVPFWDSCSCTFSWWSQPSAHLSCLSVCTPNLPPNPFT